MAGLGARPVGCSSVQSALDDPTTAVCTNVRLRSGATESADGDASDKALEQYAAWNGSASGVLPGLNTIALVPALLRAV